MKSPVKKFPLGMSDVLAVIGLGILASGLYLISLSLMLVVVGTILLGISLVSAWRQAR